MGHADTTHYIAGALVGWNGERHNLFESHLAETVVARRAGGLRSKTKPQ